MRRMGLCLGVVLALAPGVLHAEMLSFTKTFVADFELSFVAGTPLNPGPGDTDFIACQAVGALTFVFDASLNDPSQPTSVPITSVTGILEGKGPEFLKPYSLTPDLEFLHGSLTDIVRNGAGEVISAKITDLQMRWQINGPGGLTLFTQEGLPFDGSVTSIPFSDGTVLAGAADFNGYMVTPGGPLFVAIGRNRTLTAVPEPTSLALAGLGVLGVLAAARGRRGR